jgi:hypothetical protein
MAGANMPSGGVNVPIEVECFWLDGIVFCSLHHMTWNCLARMRQIQIELSQIPTSNRPGGRRCDVEMPSNDWSGCRSSRTGSRRQSHDRSVHWIKVVAGITALPLDLSTESISPTLASWRRLLASRRESR